MDSESRKLIERDSRESFCMGLKERYARKKKDNRRIFAENAVKGAGPFYCPHCLSDAIVRKDRGSGKLDHFAHIAAKTKLHKDCKNEICNSLIQMFPDGQWETERPIPANIEKDFPGLVPDISGRIIRKKNGELEIIKVIIEVQRSFLQIPIINRRTIAYSSRNPKVYILWVVPLREPINAEPFRPRLFERFLHSMYFGRVYYWWPGMGCNVLPVHFGRTKRYIEVSTWFEDGEEKSGGGYDKLYKTIKLPIFEEPVNIGQEFIASEENGFDPYKNKKGKYYKIPKRNIYKDNLSCWWSKEPEYVNEQDRLLEDNKELRYYIDDYSDEYFDDDNFPEDYEDEIEYDQESSDENEIKEDSKEDEDN